MTFRISRNEKFGAVVISEASRMTLAQPWEAGRELWVLPRPPLDVSKIWREWIGSIRADQISKANLWIISKRIGKQPTVIDEENKELKEDAHRLFLALLIVGGSAYQHAFTLSGANADGQPDVRQFGDLDRYLVSLGSPDPIVSIGRLRRTHRVKRGLEATFANPNHSRLRRGIRAFWSGLQQSPPQGRLHQFVRAIECIVKPPRRGTAVHFAQRCTLFLQKSGKAEAIVKECYDLRSAEEHFRPEDDVLHIYPQNERDQIYYRRVRQIESVARHILQRLLTAANVRKHFEDNTVDQFWAGHRASQRRLWGQGLDILAVR